MPKLYIQNAAAGYTPTSFKGAWDDTTVAVTRGLGLNAVPVETLGAPAHSTYLPSIARAETSLNTAWDVCLLRLVTAPLKANITISGAITLALFYIESNAAANFFSHIHAWVTVGDSSTVRGTLVTDDIGGSEWPIQSAALFSADAPAISSVAAQAGDRVVIEFGYRATNAVATSYTGTVYYNSSDHLADGSGVAPATSSRVLGTMYNATITFDDALTFEAPLRLTALQGEVAVQVTDNLGTTRFTQIAVEEAVTQLATTRLTQLAVELLIVPPVPITNIVFVPLAQRCQARYYANLYNTDGTLLAVFDDFKPTTIEHKINAFSNCTFSIDGLDDRINLFGLDYILEIWRDLGDYKYIEYEGFHRSDQLQYTEGGHWIYTSYSRGFEDLLVRRCLLYKADKYVNRYRLKQAPAETVLKEFVNENAGPAANNLYDHDTNPTGRVIAGAIPNFSIEADQARGPIYTANYIWRNLYEILREIAQGSGTDFAVTRQGNQFLFRCFYPTRGADKSSTLIFSPEYGNMIMPSYTLSRTEEVNTVLVLGRGEGNARWTYTGKQASVSDSPWNQRETTHDSRNGENYQEYVDTAKEVLNNLKAKEAFEFKVVQTDASTYGLDYVLGDICTVKFGAISKLKKIVGVTINIRDGVEDIDIEFSDYPTI